MAIKGKTVHKKIKEKVSEIESQTEDLASQVYQIEQTLTDLTAKREDCYVSLANTYLPELDAKTVQNTLREVRENVNKVFKEKQERRKTLENLMKENRERNNKIEDEVENITAQIEQQAQERDKTINAIAEYLQKDMNYTRRDEEAKKAEVRLQQYKKRVEEVEGEARKKLPAFEQNKIFSYLLKINFETAQYQKNRLRKTLDSWAAKKVNFNENKKCYDFLKSMPEMMKQEVAIRQIELDKIVLEMKEIEFSAEKQYGLLKIVTQAERLINQRQELIEKDKKQDESYAVYSKEREEIDSKKDSYYVQAIQKIKGYLKGEQIADLKSRAKQTKGAEDDKLVDKIDEIDIEIRKLKNKAKDARTERDAISEKLDELRSIEKRFRSKDYEGSYSSFPSSFDINNLLTVYILGQITSKDINRKIDSSQHTRTPSYHSSSDYSSSHRSSYSSDDSSSSGFGGGGFSSGGGFGGGGGFSSGGGF